MSRAGPGGPARAAPRLLAFGWGVAVLLWACAAFWVFAHAPALSSDDALFLLRGLTRFSLPDDSPQFPGYPGYVAIGRLLLALTGSPLSALALLSGAIALALPPVAALAVWRNRGAGAALAAFLLVLAMPLLPDLALSLLTDGAGLLFTLIFIALLPVTGARPGARRLIAAGMALGWAGACRPSDAVLILAAALGALVVLRGRAVLFMAAGVALVVLPVLAVLLALEPLYFAQGWRFVRGHALFWGNTPFSLTPREVTWQSALAARPALGLLVLLGGGAALAVLSRLRRAAPAAAAAGAAFLGHGLWIVAFQNPENLRHMAPLLCLGPVVICLMWPVWAARLAAALCGLAEGAALWLSLTLGPAALPPLGAAAVALAALPPGSVLATNHGVETLRRALPRLRIYDAYYRADTALGLKLASGPGLRLTSTRPTAPIARFPARFAGERTLWLERAGPGR